MPDTVPSSHTVLPAQPSSSQAFVTEETLPTIIVKANTVAKSKLKQKNRKQNEFIMSAPLSLGFESATVYNLEGFTPDANQAKWVLIEVEFKLTAKKGSELKLTFCKALDW